MTDRLSYATTAGAHALRLETGPKQHSAIRFYTRLGFQQIEPFGPHVGSGSSVCMALQLPI